MHKRSPPYLQALRYLKTNTMRKIQWLLNDAPSLPVSTFIVNTTIIIGDPMHVERKFRALAEEIYMEFDIHVWFEICLDSLTNRPYIEIKEL